MEVIKPIICDKLRNIHTILTRVSKTFERMSKTSRSDVENDRKVLNTIADSLEILNSESNLNKFELKFYKKHTRHATFACTKKSENIFILTEHIYEKLEVMNLLSRLLMETEHALQTELKKIDDQLELLKRRVDTLQDPDKRRTPTKTASSYSSTRSRMSTNTRRRRTRRV